MDAGGAGGAPAEFDEDIVSRGNKRSHPVAGGDAGVQFGKLAGFAEMRVEGRQRHVVTPAKATDGQFSRSTISTASGNLPSSARK